ncbi:MAG TPA: hypothetical protein VFL73_03770 [Solirubrobacteraceae bacterium]|nr:hypothetical protein [Solirubrobacteraceae bacterium]
MRRSLRTAAVAVLLAAGVPAAAQAAAAPETILQDDAVLLHSTDQGVRDAMTQLRALGVDRVRLTAGWSVIAPQPDSAARPDFDETDPAAYPAGAWDNLDRAVRDANDAGLRVMIDIAFWAPRWATHDGPATTGRLRTEIDPDAYARFAQAVATRYSGTYAPPAAPQPAPPAGPAPDADLLGALLGSHKATPASAQAASAPAPAPLPAAGIFTIWNEPNHPGFVMPQWQRQGNGWWPRSADIYRAMVRAAYPAIKQAAPSSTVLIGATSSGGSSTPGRSGVPPLEFIRALTCVDRRWRPITTGSCAGYTTLPGDGWSHHPYSLRTVPEKQPINHDKLPVASTPRLLAALRRLVRMGRLAPADDQVWMTEYGYETSPPDPMAPFTPEQQAGMLARAERLATADPAVRSWPQFLLRDRPAGRAGPRSRIAGDWQTGLEDADGSPKPAYTVFRTPVVAQCRGARVVVWGRWRDVAGAVAQVQRQIGGAWVDAGGPIAAGLSSAAVQAVVARQGRAPARIHWTAPGGQVADSPAVVPLPCGHPQKSARSRGKVRRAPRGRMPMMHI